ncbi:hypothetical protein D3C75_1289720 [compost metagenome]
MVELFQRLEIGPLLRSFPQFADYHHHLCHSDLTVQCNGCLPDGSRRHTVQSDFAAAVRSGDGGSVPDHYDSYPEGR